VRHAAQAVQLESYLDYGASRSAEVGVRPEHELAARGLRQALLQHGTAQYRHRHRDCDGEVAGIRYAVASVPAALSVLTVERPKDPWPKYALRLEYDAAPNRMPYLQGCAPPVL
jgi:hypothetical protein